MKGKILFLAVALVASTQGLAQKSLDSDLDEAILILQDFHAVQGDLDEDWPLIEDEIEDDAGPIVLGQSRSLASVLKKLLEIKQAIQQAINIKNCIENVVNNFKAAITEFLNSVRSLKDLIVSNKEENAKCKAIGGDNPTLAQLLQRKLCLDKQAVAYTPNLLKAVRRVVAAYKNIIQVDEDIKACLPIVG